MFRFYYHQLFGSKQMQQIRMLLRGSAIVLMDQNTMMHKVIKGHLVRNDALALHPWRLDEVRDKLLKNVYSSTEQRPASRKKLFLPSSVYANQNFQGHY